MATHSSTSKPSGRWQTPQYSLKRASVSSKPSGRWQTMQHCLNFDGSKIYLKVLKTDQRLSVPWKATDKLQFAAKKDDIKYALVSAKTPDHIQILHPETYQPLEISINQQTSNITIGEEIPVVEIEGNFYLLNKE